MKEFIVDVMGSGYCVRCGLPSEISIGEYNAGECKIYSKVILIDLDKRDCTFAEMMIKLGEVCAHEMLHAFLNEAGIDFDNCNEEGMCYFYMKNYLRLHEAVTYVIEVVRKEYERVYKD